LVEDTGVSEENHRSVASNKSPKR